VLFRKAIAVPAESHMAPTNRPTVGAVYIEFRVLEEYRAMVKYWFEGETRRNSGMSLLLCPFVHHESYMRLPGIEPKATQ
jgi:hypothetical protein